MTEEIQEITTKEVETRIIEYLEKHNRTVGYKIDFPVYKILPEEVKLALSILKKHGMQIIITFEQKQEKK